MDMKKCGFLAASAAAALFTATPIALAGPKLVKGHYCKNNICSKRSACGGKGNANGCAGQNTCKGKGWLKETSEKACEAKETKGKHKGKKKGIWTAAK